MAIPAPSVNKPMCGLPLQKPNDNDFIQTQKQIDLLTSISQCAVIKLGIFLASQKDSDKNRFFQQVNIVGCKISFMKGFQHLWESRVTQGSTDRDKITAYKVYNKYKDFFNEKENDRDFFFIYKQFRQKRRLMNSTISEFKNNKFTKNYSEYFKIALNKFEDFKVFCDLKIKKGDNSAVINEIAIAQGLKEQRSKKRKRVKKTKTAEKKAKAKAKKSKSKSKSKTSRSKKNLPSRKRHLP